MTNTFFTSDQHFGHARIIELCGRPFTSIDEMDEALIAYHNALVKPDDEVWHLGDFSFHKPDRATSILSRLHGVKHLVWGNHDGHRYQKDTNFLAQWASVHDLADIKVGKQRIVLCHFPLLAWNKSHHNSWHLHGHCHGNLKPDMGAKRIDVGVDAWTYQPVEFEEIAAEMNKRHFEPVDHHGDGRD